MKQDDYSGAAHARGEDPVSPEDLPILEAEHRLPPEETHPAPDAYALYHKEAREETGGLPDADDLRDPAEDVPVDEEDPPEEQPERGFALWLYDWAEALVSALLVISILFSFFVRTIGVKGDSMKETLHEGDYLIVSNLFYKPEAGDIVVLTKKTFMTDSIVKRVIATGGQTVDIDYESGQVAIDGKVIREPYVPEMMRPRGDMSFPLTVPEGSVFVMGDNRNHSTDSRSTELGIVDEQYIVGHVLLRIWPLSGLGSVR